MRTRSFQMKQMNSKIGRETPASVVTLLNSNPLCDLYKQFGIQEYQIYCSDAEKCKLYIQNGIQEYQIYC
jgi:hypothetical protein